MAAPVYKTEWTVGEFVRGWEVAESLDDAQRMLQAETPQAVFLHAGKLRRNGIPLKVFPKKVAANNAKPIDVEGGLKELAKIRKETVAALKKQGKEVAEELRKKAEDNKAQKAAQKAAEKAAEAAKAEAAK